MILALPLAIDTDEERWLPVVGFEGLYEVSDRGRVKRIARGRGAVAGRELATPPTNTGYPVVVLRKDGRNHHRHVHWLVLEAFVGPRPAGKYGLHYDGTKTNNAVANLRWGTQAENGLDTRRHGTAPRGERAANAKLNNFKVQCLRALAELGVSQRLLASVFGITQPAAGRIARRHRWAHVP